MWDLLLLFSSRVYNCLGWRFLVFNVYRAWAAVLTTSAERFQRERQSVVDVIQSICQDLWLAMFLSWTAAYAGWLQRFVASLGQRFAAWC